MIYLIVYYREAMKLTYRGINYKAQQQEARLNMLDDAIASFSQHLDRHVKKNKVIQVTPIHYYTYRGTSYTKNLIADPYAKLLLDIDRQ